MALSPGTWFPSPSLSRWGLSHSVFLSFLTPLFSRLRWRCSQYCLLVWVCFLSLRPDFHPGVLVFPWFLQDLLCGTLRTCTEMTWLSKWICPEWHWSIGETWENTSISQCHPWVFWPVSWLSLLFDKKCSLHLPYIYKSAFFLQICQVACVDCQIELSRWKRRLLVLPFFLL